MHLSWAPTLEAAKVQANRSLSSKEGLNDAQATHIDDKYALGDGIDDLFVSPMILCRDYWCLWPSHQRNRLTIRYAFVKVCPGNNWDSLSLSARAQIFEQILASSSKFKFKPSNSRIASTFLNSACVPSAYKTGP
jgi:hypothetical protein